LAAYGVLGSPENDDDEQIFIGVAVGVSVGSGVEVGSGVHVTTRGATEKTFVF
jgi:hypothetical protein